MRIAMIGQKGIPARDGGVERHVHDLAVRLSEKGYDITVYNRAWYAKSNATSFGEIKIVTIKTLHTKHLDTIIHTFLSTLHAIRHKHDIIHYHGVGPSLLSWIPRVFAPHIKVVTTFHSMDRKHEKWNWFAKLMLRLGEYTACTFSHTLLAVSPTIEQYARDVYDTKAIMIPNAVNITPPLYEAKHISEWGLEPGNYVLMVSRLIPHKGAHYLVDAWKELTREKAEIVQDTKLVIVGDGYYTDTYVKNLKEKAGTNPNIIFTGFQTGDTLKALFSMARFQVHPSDNEGLPICVLEGMSFALPVVLSNIPEHRDLNGDSHSLFQYGSVSSLKKRLENFLTLPPETLAQKGKQNLETIQTTYNWNKIMNEIMEVYDSYHILNVHRQVATATTAK
jgi:glycosyltransferase involved in cell wall biosynthesis